MLRTVLGFTKETAEKSKLYQCLKLLHLRVNQYNIGHDRQLVVHGHVKYIVKLSSHVVC